MDAHFIIPYQKKNDSTYVTLLCSFSYLKMKRFTSANELLFYLLVFGFHIILVNLSICLPTQFKEFIVMTLSPSLARLIICLKIGSLHQKQVKSYKIKQQQASFKTIKLSKNLKLCISHKTSTFHWHNHQNAFYFHAFFFLLSITILRCLKFLTHF